MSRERLASAFDNAAEALAQLAHELRGAEQPERVPSAPAPTQAAGRVPPSRPAAIDDSAFTKCPAHNREWKDGRFGKMCTAQEPEGVPHDGNWYNDKGYCRVTPKSAAAWLRQHPQGASAPAPQDVDDIPF